MPSYKTDHTIEDFINVCKNAKSAEPIPFKNSEMAAMIRNAVNAGQVDKLAVLIEEFTAAYIRTNPKKRKETMCQSAYENLATLCYLADHEPSQSDWTSLGPTRAFARKTKYGSSMKAIKEIFDQKNMDLKDVFSDWKGYEAEPELN